MPDLYCKTCGGILRFIGSMNDSNEVKILKFSDKPCEGLYQCTKCKDVFLNPDGEEEWQ